MRPGTAFGRACLCDCPVLAVTFESLDLEASFVVCMSSHYLDQACQDRISSLKVSAAKTDTTITKYKHSWVVHLRLKSNVAENLTQLNN